MFTVQRFAVLATAFMFSFSTLAASTLKKEEAKKLNTFNQQLLSGILSKDAGKNVFITGPAMVTAMAMLVNGATGDAKSELLQTLGYSAKDLEGLNANASILLKQLNTKKEGVTISMANAFYADESLPVVPAYKNLVEKRFQATVQNLEFARKPVTAANTINKWASDNTEEMITNIIDADTASGLDALLASAIFFKGTWETQFDPKETQKREFLLESGEYVQVDTMSTKMDVDAITEQDYVVARLPYTGKGASMYIVFPRIDFNTGKPALTADQALINVLKADELSLFAKKNARVDTYEKKEVLLPKFKIKYKNTELKEVLIDMGAVSIFNRGVLTALSEDPRLQVSYVRMDTALEIDEKGTKAAGVVSVGMERTAIMVNDFEFNRPFGIVIRDEKTGVDLFSGVIRNPLE